MTTTGIARVRWRYGDKTYGFEFRPADVDDLLKDVATHVGETGDGMIGRFIDEIDGDPGDRDWLFASTLCFACNEELANRKGFGHHARQRTREGDVAICGELKGGDVS
jgi:hypothetical protein